MQWFKKLFRLSTPMDKKRKELSELRRKAMLAQRNGDLRTFGDLSKKAEELEDEIIEMVEKGAK